MMQQFIIHRQDYHQHQWQSIPENPSLSSHQVLLKVDRFALTANNITYAAVGERIGYWQFFPNTPENWGIIPVWGFAEVVESQHPDIHLGQRYYGYYPMASHLVVEAHKVNSFGFVDGIEHRRKLPPIYNYYINTAQDAFYQAETEDLQMIFRPLFTTSFLIDDFLAEAEGFGAKNYFLTSASSKTALALAFLLKERQNKNKEAYKIWGLTSSKNLDFVQSSGFYDQAISYDQVEGIPTEPGLIVDFAGNHQLQYKIQRRLGEGLRYNCRVGLVHWEEVSGQEKLPNPGQMFFAPDQAQKRNKDWGPAKFQEKLARNWQAFLENAQSWVALKTHQGPESLSELYPKLLKGELSPNEGQVYSF